MRTTMQDLQELVGELAEITGKPYIVKYQDARIGGAALHLKGDRGSLCFGGSNKELAAYIAGKIETATMANALAEMVRRASMRFPHFEQEPGQITLNNAKSLLIQHGMTEAELSPACEPPARQ